jgi:hypothetical protein
VISNIAADQNGGGMNMISYILREIDVDSNTLLDNTSVANNTWGNAVISMEDIISGAPSDGGIDTTHKYILLPINVPVLATLFPASSGIYGWVLLENLNYAK